MNVKKFVKTKPKFNKICEFPDCGENYEGTIRSKYCPEHRKGKYRKVIDKDKNDAKKLEYIEKNQNVTINHNFNVPVDVTLECECCNTKFTITILPDVIVYPKYCEEHRNEYRRLLYMKKMGIIVELPKREIVLDDIDKDLTEEEIKELSDIDQDLMYE